MIASSYPKNSSLNRLSLSSSTPRTYNQFAVL